MSLANCIFHVSIPATTTITAQQPPHHPLHSTNFHPPHPIGNAARNHPHPLRASPENLAPPSPYTAVENPTLTPACDVVRKFYDGVNRHDLAAVEPLIALNCVYQDLVFPQPFTGRKDIIEFFAKYISYASTDLQFVIDDISEEDSSAVGVTWHLEWRGRPFPFSRGCSFYRLEVINGVRQIVYARDIVEPAIKPGESALTIIRGVTWLLQRFPNLADRL